MITPRFWISQDHNFVIVKMRLLHVKVSEVQFVVDDVKMTFSATPYFLRLTFDQKIMEDDTAKATYDIDSEIMTVLVPKLNKGEVFTDLDCVTKLLTTEKERKKLIRTIPDADESSDDSSDDYEMRQGIAEHPTHTAGGHYGFNQQFTGFFKETQEEIFCTEVEIDDTPQDTRIEMMRAAEAEQFLTSGVDQYLADHQDPSQVKAVLSGSLYSSGPTNVYGNPSNPSGSTHTKPPYYHTTAVPPTFEYLCRLGEAGGPAAKGPLVEEVRGGEVIMGDDSDSEESSEDTEEEPMQEEVPAAPQAFMTPGDIGVPLVSAPAGDDTLRTGGGLSGYLMTREEYKERNPDWAAHRENVSTDLGGEANDGEEMPPHPSKWQAGDGLTAWEREEMLRLPKKSYIVTREEEVMCGLMDLLACFCYDILTTDLEGNAESVWTLTKLSPTLSYCIPLPSVRHVIICFMRRAVTYPLFRHIALARRCLWDVAHILSQGNKVMIVRILLRMKWFFDRDELKHPLSKLYIIPYAVWVQSISSDTLKKWGSQLAASLATTPKSMLGLPLDEMEALAAEEGGQ